MKFDNVLQTIGNTPIIRMNRIFGSNANVWIKSERGNPGGSIKDRIALAMVEAAEKSGALKPGGIIIEPTSGNTGVGLALVAAVKGYKLILVMPESMSIERRRLMLAYGATFDLTPKEKGMKGAIARAQELAAQTPGAWIPQQFENPANVDIHEATTAQEILADFPDGLDVLITGVGTGGHLSGVAKVLKAKFPNLKVFAVEPAASPVISGGSPRPTLFRALVRALFPRTLTWRCWTVSSRSKVSLPVNTPAARLRRKACWSVFRRGQRWLRLRKSCLSCPLAPRCWALPMTRASAICPSRAFCRLAHKTRCLCPISRRTPCRRLFYSCQCLQIKDFR